MQGAKESPVNQGGLCVKGRDALDFATHPDRLTRPLIRENGALREATWEEALEKTATRFNAIKAEHGPDSIGVLTSARITNEENYIANKFTRAVLKTNSVDHWARL